MKKDKNNEYNKNDDSKFILDACKEISNLTEEQYKSEKKFFTSYDEELESFAKNLSRKIKNNEIEKDCEDL